MKWHFIRHGEIQSNVRHVYAGWSEEPLTVRGVQQAEAAGKQLVKMNIDAVYHSPLKRTEQTAQIIGKHLNCALIPDESFIELRMGPWEGLSEVQIAQSYPAQWELWNTYPANLLLTGRETLQELQARVLKGLASIQRKSGPSCSVLIVTHVAIIRVVQLYYDKKDLNHYKQITVNNGSMFSYEALRLTVS